MGIQPFIWLGARRSRKHPVGSKGKLLDIAASRGLPVPQGGILLHEFYELLLQEGVVRLDNGRLHAPDAAWLQQALLEDARFPRLPGYVAVRSAFAAEDQPDASLAGYFTSRLQVSLADAPQLAQALAAVWSSAARHPGSVRRDLLIMQMVDAETAGVAFSESAYQDDLVNFVPGTADRLQSGQTPGDTLRLPRLQAWERPSAGLPPFARRLQQLLRGVRRTFGDQAWDVEWADDGRICWLLQIRPITRSPRRNEAFTSANFREILPDPPSPFMAGIIAACAPDLYGYYRQFDARLPANRPIVELFAGRPLFNISLLADTMRAWGLPTRLVTNAIGGTSDVTAGFRPLRFVRSSIPLLRQAGAQATAVRRARRATPAILALAQAPGDSLAACIDQLTWLFTRFVTEMFNLTAALSLPLLLLRRAGTLAAHGATHRSISTEMLADLTALHDYAAGRPDWQQALRAGEVPDDATFRQQWQTYLARHGHRGVYESDIAQPRYWETPAALLQALAQSRRAAAPPPPRASRRGWLTWPIWWHCRRVLNAREWWRYHTMRAYDGLRQQLLTLAETAAARGQLPNRDALWLLSPDEARQLDAGASYPADFLAQREAELAALRQLELPELLYRFDQLKPPGSAAAAQDGRGPLSGLSLTVGEVRGRAWVLREPAAALPAGFEPAETILVARSIDAGWIPTFALVAGVVVEIGGDLSHGSIILREIGLPAITNVSQATRLIHTGDPLILDAQQGIVSPSAASPPR